MLEIMLNLRSHFRPPQPGVQAQLQSTSFNVDGPTQGAHSQSQLLDTTCLTSLQANKRHTKYRYR